MSERSLEAGQGRFKQAGLAMDMYRQRHCEQSNAFCARIVKKLRMNLGHNNFCVDFGSNVG